MVEAQMPVGDPFTAAGVAQHERWVAEFAARAEAAGHGYRETPATGELVDASCTCLGWELWEHPSALAVATWRFHAYPEITSHEAVAAAGTFAERAERAGHGLRLVAGGKMDAPGLMRSECACGSYLSGFDTEGRVAKDWRQHAEARMVRRAER